MHGYDPGKHRLACQGLLDMVKGAERARLLRGVWIDSNELDAFCKDDVLLPKVGPHVVAGLIPAATMQGFCLRPFVLPCSTGCRDTGDVTASRDAYLHTGFSCAILRCTCYTDPGKPQQRQTINKHVALNIVAMSTSVTLLRDRMAQRVAPTSIH